MPLLLTLIALGACSGLDAIPTDDESVVPPADSDAQDPSDSEVEEEDPPEEEPEEEEEEEPDPEEEPEPEPTLDVPTCEEAHADILRLYRAYFGRAHDISGGNGWIAAYEGGTSIADIQAAFAASAEFSSRYDALDNADFVRRVYQNALRREADADGFEYWLGLLDSGELTRAAFVAFMSDSAESRARYPFEPSAFCNFVASKTAGYVVDQTAPNTMFVRSTDGNINAVFIDKNEPGELRVSAGTTRQRVGHYGGDAAVNGNWYGGGDDYFYGYSISSGTVRGAINGDTRMGYVGEKADDTLLFGHYADIGGAVPSGADHLVSGQTLVAGAVKVPATTTSTTDPTFTNRHPRTAAGQTVDGYLILLTVDGRSKGPGMTGTETADLLIALGADRGLMLDGGGSSTLYLGGRGVVNEPSDGSPRSVGNQLIYDASEAWVY